MFMVKAWVYVSGNDKKYSLIFIVPRRLLMTSVSKNGVNLEQLSTVQYTPHSSQ